MNRTTPGNLIYIENKAVIKKESDVLEKKNGSTNIKEIDTTEQYRTEIIYLMNK